MEKLRPIRLYLTFCALALGTYAWAGLRGVRLLGDDVEASETPPPGGRVTGGHGARYLSRGLYHK